MRETTEAPPERNELLASIETFLKPIIAGLVPEPAHSGAGRPRVLPAAALWAGVSVAVARGFSGQLDVWRLLADKGGVYPRRDAPGGGQQTLARPARPHPDGHPAGQSGHDV